MLALALAIVSAASVAALWQEIPQWRIGGTKSLAASSVGVLAQPFTCPAPGKAIALIGDSHVAGSRVGSKGFSFGSVLETELASGVKVLRFGAGGQTARQGERRWSARDLPEAGLVVIGYGTNDAAPRGWLRDKTPTPLNDFKASLTRQISMWRKRGHSVAILAPPPGGSAAIAARIAPYRIAAGEVGRASGVAVFDPAAAFASCPRSQPVLAYDALHMNASGHQCLGRWLARQLCPPVS